MDVEKAWRDFTDALEEAQQLVFGDPEIQTDLEKAEGLRYLTRLITAAALTELEAHDPAYPQFVLLESPWMQYALPNPDCRYLYAALDGRFEYRIFGQRGNSRVFEIQVWEGEIGDFGRLRSADSASDFDLGPQGQLEVLLSRTKQGANCMRLPEGTCWVVVREYFYDWDTEEASELFIERQDAQYPAPPLTGTDLTDRFQLMVNFLRLVPGYCAKAVEMHRAAERDKVPFPPMTLGRSELGYEDQIGFKGMLYGQGYYQCGPEEAVILEVEPPDCLYWNFQISSEFFEACEWNVRQTSINGHQAALDADGVFRAVISQHDPGVPNWLDTAGRLSGLISARYLGVAPEAIIVPSLRVVDLDTVRNELPPETPVVTPAERSEIVRRRMHSVPRRRCS